MQKHVKQGRDFSALIQYVAGFERQVTNIIAVRRDGVWSLTWAWAGE